MAVKSLFSDVWSQIKTTWNEGKSNPETIYDYRAVFQQLIKKQAKDSWIYNMLIFSIQLCNEIIELQNQKVSSTEIKEQISKYLNDFARLRLIVRRAGGESSLKGLSIVVNADLLHKKLSKTPPTLIETEIISKIFNPLLELAR